MPKLPLQICKFRTAILNFLLISLLFLKSIVKSKFLIPKYSRITVLVLIVAPQDQVYIETNSAHLLIYTICRSGNKAKFAYLHTENTVPSKNLKLNTMTWYPFQTTGLSRPVTLVWYGVQPWSICNKKCFGRMHFSKVSSITYYKSRKIRAWKIAQNQDGVQWVPHIWTVSYLNK